RGVRHRGLLRGDSSVPSTWSFWGPVRHLFSARSRCWCLSRDNQAAAREVFWQNAQSGGRVMPAGQLSQVLRHLRRAAARPEDAPTDVELLDGFVRRRDEAAFEALVRRHGPMVLGVCRRVLRNEADAEDAFQATFVVLARKAASLRQRGLVGNWLYGVAHNAALKARAMNQKRRARERQGAAARFAAPDDSWQEL